MKKTRNTQLVFAILFLLAAVSFTFGDTGIRWSWRETPAVAAIFVVVSLVFWGFFAVNTMKLHRHQNHA